MCGYRSEVLSDENILYLVNKNLISRGRPPVTSIKRSRFNRADLKDKIWGNYLDHEGLCSIGEVIYIPGLGETFNMF